VRRAAFALIRTVAAAAAVAAAASPGRAEVVDVVVQAGHQGRPASCARFAVRACNLGASGNGLTEITWTPVVADAAAAVLRRAGYRVARRPADYAEHDTARLAVFIHFDGAVPPCASGASVGFPAGADRGMIARWEQRYRAFFPYHFVGENFTSNEAQYYGFRKVDAPKKMLIEFGELTCPAQAAWMRPRLAALGTFLGRFLIGELR
jgi:hypothetical protein